MATKKSSRASSSKRTGTKPSAPQERRKRTGPHIPPTRPKTAAPPRRIVGRSFPIVAVGASAGGLEAFSKLLERLPVDTGMAFVLVQHLDPTHHSLLTELLSRITKLPVSQVSNGTVVQPDHVYIIPPNSDMELEGLTLRLEARSMTRGQHMPVDVFMRSLAEQQKHCAIGVILSGTASDGALGIQAIKAEGGITMAQDEQSAKHSGMPRSAILTGCVDYVLPPEGIAREIERIGKHPISQWKETQEAKTGQEGKEGTKSTGVPQQEHDLAPIFKLLRTSTGVDFSHYKLNTVVRRVLRRMALQKIEHLDDYVRLLNGNPDAVQELYQDLLIKVTSFFRDPGTFETLKTEIFPKLLEDRPDGAPIRVWVPGCATGEEAYSLAIAFLEFLGDRTAQFPLQIFATDISETALEVARQGTYVENIALDVSATRLRRFFVKVDRGYQISKGVRDVCIFARQDVTRDPPFSRLDLISCRNMLIYLDRLLQNKVFPVFHYAIRRGGYLLLGSSETAGNFSDLFTLVDKKHKIFMRKSSLTHGGFYFAAGEARLEMPQAATTMALAEDGQTGVEAQKEADRIVLSKYAPAGVLVNEDMEILQFRGRTSPYLEPAPGKASLNLLRMAREGLLVEVRALMHKAKKTGRPARKENVPIKEDGRFNDVNLEVIPLKNRAGSEPCYLVMFQDRPSVPSKQEEKRAAKSNRREQIQLEQELLATKDYLQSIIEEQEATNEELKSANEEILSSNEELQSTNEELETAKEELQSTNEELTTVNEELQIRNLELNQAINDLTNLLVSVNLPVVMLDEDLRIRRFTSMAQNILKLIPADVGRPLSDINHNLQVPSLDQVVLEVIATGNIREQEVQDRSGRWYSMRIRPYKTTDNQIKGAVVVLVDIDAFKNSLQELKESRDYAEGIIETIWEPLLVLDDQLRVKTANRSFYNTFRVTPDETQGCRLFDLGTGQWNIPKLRTMLEGLIPQNGRFHDFEVEHDFPRIGPHTMLLNARVIFWEKTHTQMVLLAMQDITERKQEELERMKASLQEKEVLLKEVHHRVKNNLQIVSSLLHLQSETLKDKLPLEVFRESQNRIRSMALIHEKLYHSQDVSKIDFAEYVRNLISNLFLSYDVDPARVELEVNVQGVSWDVSTAIPCGLIINELISNALKYAFPEERRGRIRIALCQEQDRFALTVSDNGVGLPKDLDFRSTESLGFQLVSMLADQLGGTIDLHREGKTEFKIRFPTSRQQADHVASEKV